MKTETVKGIALALHTEGSHNHKTGITGPIHETPTYAELRALSARLAGAVRKMIDSPNSFEAREACITALEKWEAAQ